MRAIFAALLLRGVPTPSAFLLPPTAQSPAATGARNLCSKRSFPPPLARQREIGGSSSSGDSRCVAARLGRSWSALAAAGGGGGSLDIFDALQAGDMAFVTEYVRGGGDCSVQDSIGDTPLMLAVESESTPAVRMLIEEGGADVNLASQTTGETPLMLAAYYGYTNLARVLVNEGGANLESRNRKGETALSLACFWGNEDTVRYLLGAGADPNSRNDAGERPGDKFDAVFVPVVSGGLNDEAEAARREAERAAAVALGEEEDEEEDIMFEELDETEKTDVVCFEEEEEEEEVVGGGEEEENMAEEKGVVLNGEGQGQGQEVGADNGAGGGGGVEDEPPGPREVILDMLEKARAGAIKS